MSAGRKLGREQNGGSAGAWKADPAPSLYILPAAFPEKAILRINLQAIRSFPLAHQFRFFFLSLTVNNYT